MKCIARYAVAAGFLTTFAVSLSVAAAPVKLTYLPYYDPPRDQVEKQIIADFNAAHPDIQVEMLPRLKSNDEIVPRLASGEQIDLFALERSMSSLMYQGATMDLTPLIARDNFDMAQFRPGTTTAVTYGGHVLALPFGTGAQFAYINHDLFIQAGLPLPQDAWTTQDLAALVPKLTRLDAQGKVVDYALGVNSYWDGWAPLYLANGGEFTTPDGHFGLSQDPVPAATDWAATLLNNNPGSRWGWSGPWQQGKMAIAIDWEGRVLQHLSDGLFDHFDWSLTYVPQGDAGPTAIYGTNFVAISHSTQHPQEAWTFLKYFIEHGDKLFGQNFLYPATRAGAQSLVQNGSALLPAGHTVTEIYGPVLNPPARGINESANTPGWTEAVPLMQQAFDSIRAGKSAAKPALEAIADQVNKIFDEAQAKAVYK